MTVMQNNIYNEIATVFFVNPRQAVLREDVKLAPAYVNAFLSEEPTLCSEYCLNTTTWD